MALNADIIIRREEKTNCSVEQVLSRYKQVNMKPGEIVESINCKKAEKRFLFNYEKVSADLPGYSKRKFIHVSRDKKRSNSKNTFIGGRSLRRFRYI